jgi:hypothetical protein
MNDSKFKDAGIVSPVRTDSSGWASSLVMRLVWKTSTTVFQPISSYYNNAPISYFCYFAEEYQEEDWIDLTCFQQQEYKLLLY